MTRLEALRQLATRILGTRANHWFFFSTDRHLSVLMGATNHHCCLLSPPRSGPLQTLKFLSNPSSRCGYLDETTRHLTRLVRQFNYLFTPPPCLISTRANLAFTAKTKRSQNGQVQSFCLVEDSANAATDGDSLEGLSGRGGFGTRAARSLWNERIG